jgi:uncharacterized protein YaeQ
MALKATIYKASLQISDLERGYYATHALTLARHPSETDERMMVRMLGFALYADEGMAFGKGLCVDDEPDVWLRDLTGAVQLWLDVGQPDEKWVRKACGRSDRVVILCYGRASDIWWQGVRDKLLKLDKLTVWQLAPEATAALAQLTARTMNLSCTVQDGQVWFSNGEASVLIEPHRLK